MLYEQRSVHDLSTHFVLCPFRAYRSGAVPFTVVAFNNLVCCASRNLPMTCVRYMTQRCVFCWHSSRRHGALYIKLRKFWKKTIFWSFRHAGVKSVFSCRCRYVLQPIYRADGPPFSIVTSIFIVDYQLYFPRFPRRENAIHMQWFGLWER